jgi:hypothetical protein
VYVACGRESKPIVFGDLGLKLKVTSAENVSKKYHKDNMESKFEGIYLWNY